ncbi:hypothetical protein PAE9249_02947 [Paenibacillus sp. CECT 9249]|uniref:hypothetical protein n=1 Tax=Paenibacillus sp. CECT 9249 TaxID=2845385 RepID=UPI001E360781|nr:hypothetical protein [Paenibacillus sp. CECT 9249]CAH0120428.1 hypothetical protein PAE9249_02947 [Paenibacillus sp. CECT 9249]
MDIRILSVIISATVAILIAVSNHFLVEPFKEKRKWKKQQLSNLYSPLYALISARIYLVKDLCIQRKKIMLGSVDPSLILSKDYTHEFILKNAGYGSKVFIEAWSNYVGSFLPKNEVTLEFVTTLVKDYNKLKKELGQEYNVEELKTGIPEVIKELRN